MSSTSTAVASDHGRATAMTPLHHDIIESHILSKLDGPTLIASSCVSSQFHSLCREENLWKEICRSTWPSLNNPRLTEMISTFPSGHRSFFSNSFPTLHHHYQHTNSQRPTPEIISAVDIHYQNNPVFSGVKTLKTASDSFLLAPFTFDILNDRESVKLPGKFETDDDMFLSHLGRDMTLSWIVIDPTGRVAGNVSSLRPILVRQEWETGHIKVRYVKILPGGRKGKASELVQCKIELDCVRRDGGELHLGEVNLKIEDLDKKCLSGRESLVILQDALECGERSKGRVGVEKEIYEKFLVVRKERRERLQRLGRRIDFVDRAIRISISVSMLFLLFGSLLS